MNLMLFLICNNGIVNKHTDRFANIIIAGKYPYLKFLAVWIAVA